MASFDVAKVVIAKNEGGYQNLKGDVGNYYPQAFTGVLIGTNHGITPTTYKEYYGYVPTVAQMKSLTKDEANRIYKKLYWDKIKGDDFISQNVANIVLDHAVNSGVGTASKGLQRVLGVGIDGVIGNDTLNALNKANQQEVFTKYKEWRESWYSQLTSEYVDAWLNRVGSFTYDLALELKKKVTPFRIIMVTTIVATLGLIIYEINKK